jgi:hypothetical protein
MKHIALIFSLTSLLAGCSVAAGDSNDPQDVDYGAQAAGCDGEGMRRCIAGGGGGGCAKYCIPQCRDTVAACIRGGGGGGCASRCRDGDVSGSGSSTTFDTARCSDPNVAWQFMTWVKQEPNAFTPGERLCWCKSWHKIKNANGYNNDLTSRAAQLLCWGSTDGSIGLPNGDGDGAFPPGAAMAIYCQLNPTYSGCR